ncbi:MAG: GNAT family N-acetyltransferase [Steroidobacteraceae bacterium]
MATVALPFPAQEHLGGRIVPLGKEHLPGFHAALDRIAREERYLAMLQAPTFTRTRRIVLESLREGAIHLVALIADEVVGWCDLRPKAAVMLRHSAVLGMGVVAEWRGQGLGTRLLASALDMADARGIRRSELVVRADNAPAIALYRRFGFVEEGRCRQYLRHAGIDHDALIMARVAADQPD